jgi:hypothetical protein
VAYLRILPDDDPTMDRNLYQSVSKTNVNIELSLFYLKIVFTATEFIPETQKDENDKHESFMSNWET